MSRPRSGQRASRPNARQINRANDLLDAFEQLGQPPRQPSSGITLRVLNTTADVIPKGGVLGIDTEELWNSAADERTFRQLPGVVGVLPVFADHVGDWVVALDDIRPATIGPCAYSGLAWTRVTVHDRDHRYATPITATNDRAATASGGLARIITLQANPSPVPNPDFGRWALVDLCPHSPIRLEGYIESLAPAVATSSSMIASTALVRLRELRNGSWTRLDETLQVVNTDEFLTLADGTFVRIESWDRTRWRIYWAACNASTAAAQTTTYSET